MSFDLDGYVDVPERIRRFKEKYPDGYLTGEGEFIRDADGLIIGFLYVAEAHSCPPATMTEVAAHLCGVGTAYERIPGKTPYTKDSEVMNAETSAWGRAIQALGFDFGAVASREEVRNRQTSDRPAAAPSTNADGEFVFASGKHAGKTLGEVPRDYMTWYLENGPREEVKTAIREFMGVVDAFTTAAASDDDIPFMPSIDGLGN